MDSLYPSLLSALIVIGWAPTGTFREQAISFRGLIWLAFGYVIMVLIKFVFVQISLFWMVLVLGSLWIVWVSVIRLGVRVWPSILTSYILALAHLQLVNWYPFTSWKGIPTTYLIGLVWFFVSVSVGPNPEQKHLVLCLAYLLTNKLQTGSALSPPDDLLMNTFWIGTALVSLFIRIQIAIQSRLSLLKPGM